MSALFAPGLLEREGELDKAMVSDVMISYRLFGRLPPPKAHSDPPMIFQSDHKRSFRSMWQPKCIILFNSVLITICVRLLVSA